MLNPSSAQISFPDFRKPNEIVRWDQQHPDPSHSFSMFKALVIRCTFLESTLNLLFVTERHKPSSLTTRQELLVRSMRGEWKTIESFFKQDWPRIEKKATFYTELHGKKIDTAGAHQAYCTAVHEERAAITLAHAALETLLQKFSLVGVPLESPRTAFNSLVSMMGKNTVMRRGTIRMLHEKFVDPLKQDVA